MKVRFLTPASIELADAIGYYEDQRPGLGYELLSEVEAGIDKILQFPNAWSLYQVQEDEIIVAAVMDLRRNPTNWKDLLT